MENHHVSPPKGTMAERWKYYVIAGNQSLINNKFRNAAKQYELARQYAETLFIKWYEPNEAVSALVVTYHNIADLHRKQENKSSVLHYLEAVHKTILHALTATPIEHKRHSALLCASKRTYSALVSYKECGAYH